MTVAVLGLGASAQCSQDRLQIHYDPDRDKAVTKKNVNVCRISTQMG